MERARDAVREMITRNLTRDIRILIRAVTYYLPQGFTLEPEDSRTEGHSITYRAYPAEEVYLVGGMVVTNWSPYRDKIWQFKIPEGRKPLHLFENGWRVQMARTPKLATITYWDRCLGARKTPCAIATGTSILRVGTSPTARSSDSQPCRGNRDLRKRDPVQRSAVGSRSSALLPQGGT